MKTSTPIQLRGDQAEDTSLNGDGILAEIENCILSLQGGHAPACATPVSIFQESYNDLPRKSATASRGGDRVSEMATYPICVDRTVLHSFGPRHQYHSLRATQQTDPSCLRITSPNSFGYGKTE